MKMSIERKLLITEIIFCDIIVTLKFYVYSRGGEMAKAKKLKQLSFIMPNKAGLLSEVSGAVADAGININYAYGTTVTGKSSTCVFQTSDDAKAVKVINK
jgi:hypothetical protein